MMNNLGDFDTSAVVYGKFVSARADTGAPATLTSGAISVYKDASTTQSTTGVTFTGDFDSVTGLNHFVIDTSADGSFYAAGSFFDIVVTTGTVNSVSAVGYCVGQFTLRKTAALKPTTTGRTLDVSAGGEAGVDWANVGSPTTSLALTGTTIAITQKVDIDTIKTNPVVNGGTVTFPTNATLASTTNITAGTIATVSGNVNGNVGGSVASVTGLTASNLDATISSRLASASYTTPPTANQNADALLDRADAVETGWSIRMVQRILFAVLGGKASGMGTATGIFRSGTDAKDRVTATIDASGNRTAVTLDGS